MLWFAQVDKLTNLFSLVAVSNVSDFNIIVIVCKLLIRIDCLVAMNCFFNYTFLDPTTLMFCLVLLW